MFIYFPPYIIWVRYSPIIPPFDFGNAHEWFRRQGFGFLSNWRNLSIISVLCNRLDFPAVSFVFYLLSLFIFQLLWNLIFPNICFIKRRLFLIDPPHSFIFIRLLGPCRWVFHAFHMANSFLRCMSLVCLLFGEVGELIVFHLYLLLFWGPHFFRAVCNGKGAHGKFFDKYAHYFRV